MPLQPTQSILNGRYRILRQLGEGGFARVWLAEDTTRRLEVAIKEPRPGLTGSQAAELADRFARELRYSGALFQVEAPNTVRVITVEEWEAAPLLVMEYCGGGSLRERLLRDGPLPVGETVRLALDLLAALRVIHDTLGWVHRDLKPANVLFTADGRTRLADFGLAQTGDSGRSSGGQPHPGSVGYMSPEQETTVGYLTPASDLYALGCVLFESLTGKLYKRVRPGTRAGSLRPDVPAWLDDVLARALNEDPWSRYESAEEMAAALREGVATQHETQHKAELDAERARRAEQERQRREAEERTRKAAEQHAQAEAARKQLEAQQRQAEAEKAKQARREAEQIAQAEAEAAQRARQEQEQREAAERAQREAETRAAARRQATPWMVGVAAVLTLILAIWHPWTGGAPATPAPTQIPTPTKASESMRLPTAVPPTKAPEPTKVPPPTATPTTEAPTSVATATVTPPPVPAFAVKEPTINVRDGPGSVYSVVGALRQGDTFEITGRSQTGDWWQFTYNGKPAWVSDSVVNANSQAAGAPVVAAPPTPKPIARTQTGRIAFVSNRDGATAEIYVMNADGSNQTRLTNNQSHDGDPAWSPDGKKIAFVSGRDGNYEIYVMNADGSNQTRLTTSFGMSPTWSPDEKRMAFRCGQICVMNSDGSEVTILTEGLNSPDSPAWSPAGNGIAFEALVDSSAYVIYVVSISDRRVTQLTKGYDRNATWNPGGTMIAFDSSYNGNMDICVISADGSGAVMCLANNPALDGWPAWSP